MAFVTPIVGDEAQQILAWHMVGLSVRDMRELMAEIEDYPHVVRSKDGISKFLRKQGIMPHPSPRGPSSRAGDRLTHCDKHDPPVKRVGIGNECPVCKRVRDKERREAVKAGLDDRLAKLCTMGDEAAYIALWIRDNVKPR